MKGFPLEPERKPREDQCPCPGFGCACRGDWCRLRQRNLSDVPKPSTPSLTLLKVKP